MKGSTWLTKAIFLCLAIVLSHRVSAQPGVTISRKSLTAVEVYQLLDQYRNYESITFQECAITYG